MSTDITDALENIENTEDTGTAEEKQTVTETIRKETARFDVAENDEGDAVLQNADEDAVLQDGADDTPSVTIRKTAVTDAETDNGDAAQEDETAEPEDENAEPGKTTEVRKPEEGAETGTDTEADQEGTDQDETDQGETNPDETDQDADEEKTPEPEKDPEIEEIKKRIRERKREKKRKARRRRTLFWTVFSIIALSVAAFIFSLSSFFIIDSIEVHGNSHFTAEEIINIGHAVPGHNLIYHPESKTITDYLEQNPYIKSASVTRKLPSTLVITVKEREEAISFNYDDDYLIMDDEGILLKKTRTEPKITRVSGLVVTRIKLGETVGTENQQMYSRLLRLVRAMKAADMYFVAIDMSGYEEDMSVTAYIYDKLIVKTDYESLVSSLKNGRLHRIVEKLFEDDVKRGTITLGSDGSASFEPGI